LNLSYLLNYFRIKRSTYYFNLRTFFSIDVVFKKTNNTGKKTRDYCFTTKNAVIHDDEIKKIILNIYSINDPYNPNNYIKFLGSKKLSAFLKKQHGIIINHKKLDRLKKELNLFRSYKKHSKHPKKRPQDHDVTAPNQYWEADIKFIPVKDGHLMLFDVIDVFDKNIVCSYIGDSCKASHINQALLKSFKFRNIDNSKLIIRTDNGSQFKSNSFRAFLNEYIKKHEFGYKNNPNSQAFIESHHSNLQREFVANNTFTDVKDVYEKYVAYMDFYHNIRPHGSLDNSTPTDFHKDFVSYSKSINDESFLYYDFVVKVKRG